MHLHIHKAYELLKSYQLHLVYTSYYLLVHGLDIKIVIVISFHVTTVEALNPQYHFFDFQIYGKQKEGADPKGACPKI